MTKENSIEDSVRERSEEPVLEIFDGICPRCGSEGAHGEIHHSGNENLTCCVCGFARKIIAVEDRKKTKKKRHFQPLLGKDGKPVRYTTEIQGFGGFGYHFKDSNKGGVMAALREPVDGDLIAWFGNLLKDPEIDTEVSYLAEWDEKEKKLTYIFGSPEWLEAFKRRPPAPIVSEEFVKGSVKPR